jgi:hypothetical protein
VLQNIAQAEEIAVGAPTFNARRKLVGKGFRLFLDFGVVAV